MSTIVTEPAANALIVVDEMAQATLSDIARMTGKPMSTVQRTVDGLLDAKVLTRQSPRGPVSFSPDAPRQAGRTRPISLVCPTTPRRVAIRATSIR